MIGFLLQFLTLIMRERVIMKTIDIIQIPNIDDSFVDELLEAEIADSGLESNGDVYYSYEETGKEYSEERLKKFGFDVEKIKKLETI